MSAGNRREVLAQGAGALVTAATGALETGDACRPPGSGPKRDYFPNVTVTTHEGERARFYDDLLAGKTVMLHCFSLAGDGVWALMQNLVAVQRLLGARLGREVFLYSLSVDPVHDTPQALRTFARRLGVGPGWKLLTGAADDVAALRRHLYVSGHHHTGADCSLGLLRYGNEAVGLWGSVPTRLDPRWIVERLGWILPRPPASEHGVSRRRGPTVMPWMEGDRT